MTRYSKFVEDIPVDFYYKNHRNLRDMREIPTIGYSFTLNGEKMGGYIDVIGWGDGTDVKKLKEIVEFKARDVIKTHTI